MRLNRGHMRSVDCDEVARSFYEGASTVFMRLVDCDEAVARSFYEGADTDCQPQNGEGTAYIDPSSHGPRLGRAGPLYGWPQRLNFSCNATS